MLEVILIFRPGAIFLIENLDYESSHEYYLTVEATDGGTPSLSDVATVNVNVTDINDNTPVFSQDPYTAVISEDAVLEQPVITVRVCSPRLLLLGLCKTFVLFVRFSTVRVSVCGGLLRKYCGDMEMSFIRPVTDSAISNYLGTTTSCGYQVFAE